MWLKITHLTNEKYANVLSPLGVEQIKKLFSNCKRRRRIRSETEDCPTTLSPTSPDSGAVVDAGNTADMVPSLDSSFAHDENTSQNLRNLIQGLDLSIEIRDLKRQLAESEAEVARLQRVVVEQANDCRNRINVVIDFLKASIERKVAEDQLADGRRTSAGKPKVPRLDEAPVNQPATQTKSSAATNTKQPLPEAKTQADDSLMFDMSDASASHPGTSGETWIPYPEVKEPTESEKKRRAAKLEEEKRKKKAEGFYQPRSDVDDTLDQIQSLDMERSEEVKKVKRFRWLRAIASVGKK
ncbi:hypothetical protein OESDEN_07974 [Oesophagostomum dentatum]|uniref:Uncharacterized protein n=1 Tax=Oesophagostomum dentatum TaxID=61180 RepID=A0A0B1T8Q2_OESDE|nr:hypothetical protein OESDEN_07974 [Oesophagostomum dentatum]